MFQGYFKKRLNGVSRKMEGCFKGVLVSERSSKVFSRQFQKCFKEVLRVFKKRLKFISRKFRKKLSRMFQKCSNEVLFCNVVLAWISSQLPEQKEGLL